MPEGPPYFQLIEGELIQMPTPGLRHQRIVGNLLQILCAYVGQTDSTGEVHLGPLDVYLSDSTVLVPDLFFVSAGRTRLVADDGVHGPPDLVIEVVIPATARLDKRRKLPLYARYGVKELWLVDPVMEVVYRYDLAQHPSRFIFVDSHENFETALLPGLIIGVGGIFRE